MKPTAVNGEPLIPRPRSESLALPVTRSGLGDQIPYLLQRAPSKFDDLLAPYGCVVYKRETTPDAGSVFIFADRHWNKSTTQKDPYWDVQIGRYRCLERLHAGGRVQHLAFEAKVDSDTELNLDQRFLTRFRQKFPNGDAELENPSDDFLREVLSAASDEWFNCGFRIFLARRKMPHQGFEERSLWERYAALQNLGHSDSPDKRQDGFLPEALYHQEARSAHGLVHVLTHPVVRAGGAIAMSFGFLHLNEISRFLDTGRISIPAVVGMDDVIYPEIERAVPSSANVYILCPTAYESRCRMEQLAFVCNGARPRWSPWGE